MKRPEYVAVTIAAYRRALDALYAGVPFDTAAAREDLKQMFNRGGFTRGYGPGMAESALMYPERPNHIGVEVGRCVKPGKVELYEDIDPADALVIRRGSEDMPVKLSGRAGETAGCPKAQKGDRLVRLVSEAQMRAARDSFDGEHRPIRVFGRVSLKVGQPACLTVSDGKNSIEVTGDVVQPAKNRGLDVAHAKAQLCKTGGTPYIFDKIDIDGDENAFAPASMLNALRRDALDRLTAARTTINRTTQKPPSPREVARSAGGSTLYAQSGDPEVLRRALASGADAAVYSPEDLRNLTADGLPERFALAVPAVLTAEALDRLNRWANDNADRITETFLSNVGQLGLSWPGRLTGDYMLNVGNDQTVQQLSDWGMEAVTPSVELTAAQTGMIHGNTNLILWGRIPLMHLRHCPLRATRGMKGLHADCRHCDACKPEDRLNGRTLVDRRGAAFPLNRLAMPGGCVIQVLNSVPLMPLKRLDKLPKADGWRLLLRRDEPVEAVVKVYRAALDGRDFKSRPEWEIIETMNTTTGHYFRGVD